MAMSVMLSCLTLEGKNAGKLNWASDGLKEPNREV